MVYRGDEDENLNWKKALKFHKQLFLNMNKTYDAIIKEVIYLVKRFPRHQKLLQM